MGLVARIPSSQTGLASTSLVSTFRAYADLYYDNNPVLPAYLQKVGHLVEVLTKLATSYRVSLKTMAERLLELGIICNVIVIRWDWLLKPNEPPGSMPKLRVDWAKPNTYPYIPPLPPAPRGSIFERASSIRQVLREHNVPINIGSLKGFFEVEALSYGESKGFSDRRSEEQLHLRSVLSVIWLEEPSRT